ncbi:unnamed protein product [Sympodiomycopsis kandeliae]
MAVTEPSGYDGPYSRASPRNIDYHSSRSQVRRADSNDTSANNTSSSASLSPTVPSPSPSTSSPRRTAATVGLCSDPELTGHSDHEAATHIPMPGSADSDLTHKIVAPGSVPLQTRSRLPSLNRSTTSLRDTTSNNLGSHAPTSKTIRQRASFLNLLRPKVSKSKFTASSSSPSPSASPTLGGGKSAFTTTPPLPISTHLWKPSDTAPLPPLPDLPSQGLGLDMAGHILQLGEPSRSRQSPDTAAPQNAGQTATGRARDGSDDLQQLDVPNISFSPPPSTSLRDIRKSVAHKAAMPAPGSSSSSFPAGQDIHAPSTSVDSSCETPGRTLSSNKTTMQPRSAGGNQFGGDSEETDAARQEDESQEHLDNEGVYDEAEGLAARRRAAAKGRRMTMLDFLASDPRDFDGRPSTAGAPRLTIPTSTSSPPESGLLGYTGSSVPTSASSNNLNFPVRRRPQSMIAQSPTKAAAARDGSDEGHSAEEGPRGLLDFSAGSGQRSLGQSSDAQLRAQRSEEEERKRMLDQVKVSVTPMTDTLTMFGSTQTSANYSLSGTVAVSLPRPQKKSAQLRQEQSSGLFPASNPHADGNAGHDASEASEERQRTSSVFLTPPMIVKSLSLTFAGHSIYADLSGRYSGIQLCEVKQELLTDGDVLPLASDLEPHTASTADEPLKYEIQFDVNVPGWLPGSACSRFGATFYNVSATAIIQDSDAGNLSVTESSSMDVPISSSPETLRNVAESGRPIAATEDRSLPGPSSSTSEAHRNLGTTNPRDRTSGDSHAEQAGPSSSSNFGPSSNPQTVGGLSATASRVPTVKQKSKGGSWLSKRAKQLSLKSRSSSPVPGDDKEKKVAGNPVTPLGSTLTLGNRVPQKIRVHRPERPGRARLPDGNIVVKSNKQLVIIRRCRDVVPVPVARMAIVGDHLPDGAQDAPSLPQAPSGQSPAIGSAPVTAQDLPATGAGGSSSEVPPVEAPESSARTDADEISTSQTTATPEPPTADTSPPILSTTTDQTTELPAPNPSVASGQETRPQVDSLDAGAASASDGETRASGPESGAQSQEVVTQTSMNAPPPMPVAPSAFNAPSDPAKLNAASRLPSAPIRTSSAVGRTPDGALLQPGADRGTTTGSSGSSRGGPPMRHFLHRPVLHPPGDSGIEDAEGLPFSLTISVPSHIHVQSAEVLTFGVQVEVGRTAAWGKVRELGGLRLRDMELICLQTERHTSIPSRTFCATFPVPPSPKVASKDLPVLPEFTPPLNKRPLQSSQEVRVRSAYDQQAVLANIHMVETGRAPPSEGNDVERVRTMAVGPPPSFQREQQKQIEQQKDKQTSGKGKDKGKDRNNREECTADGARHRHGTMQDGPDRPGLSNDPSPHSQAQSSGTVVASSSGSAGRVVSSTGSHSGSQRTTNVAASNSSSTPGALPWSSRTPSGTNQSLGALLPAAPVASGRSTSPARPIRIEEREPTRTRDATASQSTSNQNTGNEDGAPSSSPVTPRRAGRGRRAYEATMRGLSAFATAMMDVGYEESNGNGEQGPSDSTLDRDQPKASYNFSGDDGHGVDLTKGRIRMSVNLPLVSSSASMARRENTPQLVSDYESPHMRIRHKLKIKLGFGFGAKPLGGEGDWGQALVMCVPVRFTEAPPKEVREQFAPLPITVTSADSNGNSSIQPQIMMTDPNTAPVLPAYTQLFRDDGSRLNEAEDLPAYPGPRRKPLSIQASRPKLSHRGSVTGPLTPRSQSGGLWSPSLGGGHSRGASGVLNGEGGGNQGAPSPTIPPTNSLAPEQILDDEIQGLTDPDESMAAMREQERDLQEMQEGGVDDLILEDRQRYGTNGHHEAGGIEIDDLDDEDSDRRPENLEDTVVVGGEGEDNGHEDRIRAVEEELGI